MTAMQLRRLEPEPWGSRMRRAREAAGLTIRQVEEVLFPHVSRSTLVRLEDRQEVPTDRKNRSRAALLLLVYGYQLEDLELSETDLPPVIDMKALERIRRTVASTPDYALAA